MDRDDASARHRAFLLDHALQTEGIQRALKGDKRLEASLRNHLERSVHADGALDERVSELAAASDEIVQRKRASHADDPVEWGWWSLPLVLAAAGLTMGLLVLIGASTTLAGAVATAGGSIAWILFLFSIPARLERAAARRQKLEEDTADLRERIDLTMKEELRPIVRARLNQLVDPPFGQDLAPADVDGLRSLFDAKYDVSLAATKQLEGAIEWLEGGSVGIAGPRGVGKTTLIRAACEGRLDVEGSSSRKRAGQPIGVLISAPVRYRAEDVVRLIFAQLCLEVLSLPPLGAKASRGTHATEPAGRFDRAIRRLLPFRPEEEDPIRATARNSLDRLRYLETLSQEQSGALAFKVATLGESRSRSRTGQTWTFPEVIAEYRRFVGRLAERHRVVIGIDELDKMVADEARGFLGEMKSLFDQTGVFYLVSVSEDALSNFERRGRPTQDVFDSAFTDVLRVDYLRLGESASMLDTRAIGITPPWPALFHCLAGGLPRETLRVARRAVQLAAAGTTELQVLAPRLVAERVHAHEHAVTIVARERQPDGGVDPLLSWLRELPPVGVNTEAALRMRLNGVGTLTAASGAASWQEDRLELLVMQLAAGWHHALTCLEYFDALAEDDFQRQCESQGTEEAPIELLARGQHDLALSPAISWQTVDQFRQTVGLSPWSYPATGAAL